MNEELFRRLVKEANAHAYAIHDNSEQLRRLVSLVAEECARMCDEDVPGSSMATSIRQTFCEPAMTN